MTALPSGTVTFLFTDIERSTQTVEQMGNEAYADALDTHRQLLREAFKSHDGHEVGTEGDSFFVAFPRARDAVEAALQGQRSLEGHPLRVRMGMHTGEALVRLGEYVGHDVHKAKRISDAGHGGQILLSETTADLFGKATLIDLGPHRLKDLGEPQHLFQVCAEGLPTDFPALRSLEAFRHNLPAQRSVFVGREDEIASVRKLLADHRLVTLTGIGGCGKTRLAIQVGAEVLDEYADGVFFVGLGPISDAALVPRTIGDAAGLPSGPFAAGAGEPVEEQLLGYLAQRTCLIILDNCEHLLDACAGVVDRVQQRCPGVVILATSREVLGVDGEQAYGVPSLGLPTADSVESEAVSLFISRAQTSRPDFELTAVNGKTIAEICRRLDGIPLAIEFAAARVTHLSPQQIADRLDDRFRLLTGGRRQVQRQQTLQAALDWSHDLLTEPERVLLRRLAVFPADFSLAAAEEICADDDLDLARVTDLLGSLVSKSLVLAEPAGDEVRYRLLETVRAYASERLTHAGEAERLRDGHRDWYLAMLESKPWDESIIPEFGGTIFTELSNLRASMEWSEGQGRADLVCRMLARNPMGWVLFADGKRWLMVARQADEHLDPEVRAALLLGESSDAQMDFDTARGYELIDLSVDVARSGHPAVLAVVLAERGWFTAVLAAWTRDLERADSARRDFDEALALSAHRWPHVGAHILVRRGEMELTMGDVAAASTILQTAVDQIDVSRSLFSLSYAKVFLAAALHVLGDAIHAAAIVKTVDWSPLDRFIGLEVPESDFSVLRGTAAAVLGGGDLAEAKAFLLASKRDVTRSPVLGAVEEWLVGAAAVLSQGGDNERASRLLAWVRSVTYETGSIAPRTPAAHTIYVHYVAKVREALGSEVARRCRDEGRSMSRDQAFSNALEGLEAL